MPISFLRSATPYDTTPKMPMQASSSVSRPIETTTALAIRGSRVWRSKSSLSSLTPGNTRESPGRGFAQHRTQSRGIGPCAGDQQQAWL